MIGDISIIICVFFVMLGIVRAIPNLTEAYRERFQASSQRTSRELNRYFIQVKPAKIMAGAAILAVILGILSGSWVISVAIIAAGAVAPKIMLNVWREIRSKQFDLQLLDALMLLGNSLKSGLDIVAGIERISTTMKAPVSEEFGLVMNSYRLGTPLETALADLSQRINSRNLSTVVNAITIQRETGGNIIKTFDQLVLSIREESKLQKKVDAITSQGRTQIFFLAGFPWALGVIFFFMSPDFIQPALVHPMGQFVILFLVIWEIIGIIVTRRIVEVDV
jgi:tight adherence protein B